MTMREVPRIFSYRRARLRRERAWRAARGAPARFLLDEMVEDMIERLAFVRHTPQRALVLGDLTGRLAAHLRAQGGAVNEGDIAPLPGRTVIDPEAPYPLTGFDFIAVLGLIDAVNDVPGALIHVRQALAPRGLAIVSFIGAASLPALRTALLAAEPDRPAARIHPLIDPRAAPALMQRASWSDPVVDTRTLDVRYPGLARLVSDLRDHGLASALADAPPPLGKAARARAEAAFAARAGADGKTTERFDLLTLTGRRSRAGT